MPDISLAQVLYIRITDQPPQLRGRSQDFDENWLPLVEQLLIDFGIRPWGLACPSAIFAQPLDDDHIAVVQVADQPTENGVAPLGFHVLVIPRADYGKFTLDPFTIADGFPPPWSEHGPSLPTLAMPASPPPHRTVTDIQRVLKRIKADALRDDQDPSTIELTPETAESPALLGGVQVLVDGGKLLFVRPTPDQGLIRSLWSLLPNRDRSELWPATFAFSNELAFDALVVARLGDNDYTGYTTEDQAADYPAGRYELSLQSAAESADQAALDHLFTRRSTSETLRLALIMIIVLSIGLFAMRFLSLRPDPDSPRDSPPIVFRLSPEERERAAVIAAMAGNHDPWTSASLFEVLRYRRAERAASAAGIIASDDPMTAIIQVRAAQARYVDVWKEGK